jgi:RNA polymerase sigma-70 factor (ECF subfamily)
MIDENLLFLKYRETNDKEYFEELYNATKPWLYGMIYRIVQKKDLADEVLQDTWITIIKRKDEFDSTIGKFNNYIFTIAKNNALYQIKYNSRYVPTIDSLTDGNSRLIDYNSPDKIIENFEKENELLKAISKLPKDYESVILLYYFAELDIKQIAKQTNKPEGTIKTWLSRGRTELKKLLRKNNFNALFSLFYFL